MDGGHSSIVATHNSLNICLNFAASQSSTVSSASAAPSTASSAAAGAAPTSSASGRGGFARQGSLSAALTEDAEDTMKNLRKTFAGIFGDM